MKGIILHDHEVRQLSATGTVLVVREINPQPVHDAEAWGIYWDTPNRFKQYGVSTWGLKEKIHDSVFDWCKFYPVGTQFYVKKQEQIIVQTVSVECKRVQEITPVEIIDVGDLRTFPDGTGSFSYWWTHRNPKHPWSSNPWVWFATLKRIEHSARPLNSQTY